MKLDDTIHTSNIHGICSLYALLSICFFHKEEGFFFKDIYTSYIETESKDKEIAPVLLVLGSNSLASLAVMLLSSFACFVVFRVCMSPMLRVSKVQEILGQDIYHLFIIGDRILKNHIVGVINAFYPDPTGETAIKKRKLMHGVGLKQDPSSKSDV